MASGTRTGGREATRGVIPGRIALSVGRPNLPEPAGFEWRLLTDIARLESGHTPSRSNDRYWHGSVPWIGIRDATGNHGRVIHETLDNVTQAGLDNSSARLLPKGTVCLSRTASVGYVVEMGRPMATSQDFVNWVCGPELNGQYLRYILMLEQESVRRFAHGTTHQTMYYPEAKGLYVLVPRRLEQDAIAEVLGAFDDKILTNDRLSEAAERLMIALAGSAPERVEVSQVARQMTASMKNQDFPAEVAHFSLPAFDLGAVPDVTSGESIKSNKFKIVGPSVLVSKLNPRIPRIWNVPLLPDRTCLASTEFVVLVPDQVDASALWASLSQTDFSIELAGKVAGTSGSHQRVRPTEMMSARIRDPRSLAPDAAQQISALGIAVHLRRTENRALVATRDALLPLLMSGKVRVKTAEKTVEEPT